MTRLIGIRGGDEAGWSLLSLVAASGRGDNGKSRLPLERFRQWSQCVRSDVADTHTYSFQELCMPYVRSRVLFDEGKWIGSPGATYGAILRGRALMAP